MANACDYNKSFIRFGRKSPEISSNSQMTPSGQNIKNQSNVAKDGALKGVLLQSVNPFNETTISQKASEVSYEPNVNKYGQSNSDVMKNNSNLLCNSVDALKPVFSDLEAPVDTMQEVNLHEKPPATRKRSLSTNQFSNSSERKCHKKSSDRRTASVCGNTSELTTAAPDNREQTPLNTSNSPNLIISSVYTLSSYHADGQPSNSSENFSPNHSDLSHSNSLPELQFPPAASNNGELIIIDDDESSQMNHEMTPDIQVSSSKTDPFCAIQNIMGRLKTLYDLPVESNTVQPVMQNPSTLASNVHCSSSDENRLHAMAGLTDEVLSQQVRQHISKNKLVASDLNVKESDKKKKKTSMKNKTPTAMKENIVEPRSKENIVEANQSLPLLRSLLAETHPLPLTSSSRGEFSKNAVHSHPGGSLLLSPYSQTSNFSQATVASADASKVALSKVSGMDFAGNIFTSPMTLALESLAISRPQLLSSLTADVLPSGEEPDHESLAEKKKMSRRMNRIVGRDTAETNRMGVEANKHDGLRTAGDSSIEPIHSITRMASNFQSRSGYGNSGNAVIDLTLEADDANSICYGSSEETRPSEVDIVARRSMECGLGPIMTDPTMPNDPWQVYCSQPLDPMKVIHRMVNNIFGPGFQFKSDCWDNDEMFVRMGRPCLLKTFKQRYSADVASHYSDMFRVLPWITGLESGGQVTFFCWPCLLYVNPTYTRWHCSTTDVWKSVRCHQTTPTHVACFARLKFRENQLKKRDVTVSTSPKPVTESRQGIADSNERFLLELTIRTLVSKKRTLGMRLSSISGVGPLIDNIAQLMHLVLKSHSGVASSFAETKPLEQSLKDFVSLNYSQLMSLIVCEVKRGIIADFAPVPYVTLMYEETPPHTKHGVLAVIIRYAANDGEVKERFLKCFNSSDAQRLRWLCDVHKSIVTEFNLANKLVGYTYNGITLPSNLLTRFDDKSFQLCPKAVFFHHPAQNMQEAVVESLYHSNGCREFLFVIMKLVEFFKVNANAMPLMKTWVPIKKSKLNPHTVWGMILVLRYNFIFMLSALHAVAEDEEQWIFSEVDFFSFLKSRRNRFLLVLISEIIEEVSKLIDEVELCVDSGDPFQAFEETKIVLEALSKHGFSNLCRSASNIEPVRRFEEFSSNVDYKKMASELPQLAWDVVSYRLRRTIYEKKIASSCPSIANKVSFEAQMQFCREDSTFRSLTERQTFKYIVQNKLASTLPEKYRFLRYKLAFPDLPDLRNSNPLSANERFQDYAKQVEKWDHNDALIFLEKDFILASGNNHFYNNIINDFMKPQTRNCS